MLDGVAQYTNDVIIILDREGRLVDANQRFFDIYGYSPGDMPGLDVLALRSPTGQAHCAEDFRLTERVGAITFETEHRHKNGTVFPVEVSSRLLDYRGEPCKVSIIRDISQRKNGERAHARLLQLHQAIREANKALLRSTSHDEIFARICALTTDYGLALAWIGLAEADRIRPVHWSGRGGDYLRDIHVSLRPDDPHSQGPAGMAFLSGRHKVCNDFLNAPETAPWHERARIYGWRASAAFPLFCGTVATGTLTLYSEELHFFGPEEIALLDELAADISFFLTKEETEARKRELEQDLHHSIEHLAAVNLELERFSEIYWHDLQEPVRHVVSFSQLLERRLSATQPAPLPADSRETLAMLIQAAKRIGQLNRDLQSYSQARHPAFPMGPVETGKAVDYACAALDGRIRALGAEIRHAGLPVVLGSAPELRQVFLALLSNALKFVIPGRPPRITVIARPEERGAEPGWHITVEDNGIGIEEAFLEKIFGVFVRLHSADAYPGSGIGLAICRTIMAHHGGRIWAESRPGEGSAFHLWLRAAAMPKET